MQWVVLTGKEETNLKLSNGCFSFFNELQVLLCYGHIFCLNGGLTPVIIATHTFRMFSTAMLLLITHTFSIREYLRHTYQRRPAALHDLHLQPKVNHNTKALHLTILKITVWIYETLISEISISKPFNSWFLQFYEGKFKTFKTFSRPNKENV